MYNYVALRLQKSDTCLGPTLRQHRRMWSHSTIQFSQTITSVVFVSVLHRWLTLRGLNWGLNIK
jgi:hypothetical protein